MKDERRRRPRSGEPASEDLHVGVELGDGTQRMREARLVDVSDWGIGFETPTPMVVGADLWVWGAAVPNAHSPEKRRRVNVMHCRMVGEGAYRAGCAFEETPRYDGDSSVDKDLDDSFVDFYEILQVSANADSEMIHRVYRMLAQRYHPDNPDTGDARSFQAILKAYQTLNDPSRRAQYDLGYQTQKRLRWKIFAKPAGAKGMETEKRKRAGVLAALYTKRIEAPEKAGVTIREMEELLGVPREHLEFSVWYLRRKGYVDSGDNGKFEISAEGVDAAEQFEAEGLTPTAMSEDRQIEAAHAMPEAGAGPDAADDVAEPAAMDNVVDESEVAEPVAGD